MPAYDFRLTLLNFTSHDELSYVHFCPLVRDLGGFLLTLPGCSFAPFSASVADLL
jgi:hypothetical protein